MKRLALALPFVIFLALYGTSVGHGFVADDFLWILDSRVAHISDVPAIFERSTGFYRPVVGLSFAANYVLFGNQPLGYGLTNLVLALACGGLLFVVCRQLDLQSGAALFAVALWFGNPHGINTAILWMSGRTALLLTFGSLGAVLLVLRGRPFLALAPAAAALFAKEEAVLLPVILLAWWIATRDDATPKRVAAWVTACSALMTVYLVLRFHSGAMTPWSAPPYYRFTANPRILSRNLLEYADRAMTFPLLAAALALAILRPTIRTAWIRRPVLICGAVWIAAGYGLTMFLPVRSSLYACFPSAGTCLLAADVAGRRWNVATERSRRVAVAVGIVVAIAMAPVYQLRNRTTLANAHFSSSILRELDAATSGLAAGDTVVVHDDRNRRPNLDTAFNTGLNDAFELVNRRRLAFWVEPARTGNGRPCAGCARVTLAIRDGHVVK